MSGQAQPPTAPGPTGTPADAADCRVLVDGYLQRFGAAVGAELEPLDRGGYTEVRYGQLLVGINVEPERRLLVLLVRMGTLPRTPTPEFYRTLLEHNFLATGPCAFAIDAGHDTVYLRALRRTPGLDYEEFEELLQTIAKVAADMRERMPTLSYLQR